ncbi:hypothetical protein [Pseudonocardia sp. N23]|uniref:hypothetical protein n=1 Tax=Pseudonocardia sp. N23 TaxID=1987376 RepID=UPI000C0343AF|nr:hypothetical protein [Pseudonocardia sp. N23]GAY12914.1 hypothetical protein TOK_1467 [Pseudonocardia sp. N23]
MPVTTGGALRSPGVDEVCAGTTARDALDDRGYPVMAIGRDTDPVGPPSVQRRLADRGRTAMLVRTDGSGVLLAGRA